MTAATPTPRRAGIFYGWYIVAAVFLMLLVTAGLGFYNASVILSVAAEELDTDLGKVSFGPTLFFGIAGFTGFAISKQLELVDLRWFYLAGAVTGGLALTGLRWVDSVLELYVFFALFGIGFALCGLVVGTTIIARWFTVKRAVALSIGSTGLSVGGIVMTPFAASAIEEHGLAAVGPPMGLIWFLGVAPVSLLVIRSFPSDLKLEPDGAPTPTNPVPLSGASLSQALSTRFFRALCVAYALVFLAQVGGIAQLFNLARERTDSGTAELVLSTMAFASVIGRLIGGAVVNTISARAMAGALTVVQGIALVGLAFADSRATLVGCAALFGLSVGNLLMLQPLLIAEAFGIKSYGRIYSLSQLIATVGTALGPFVLGYIHDLSSYETAFMFAAGCNVAGLVAIIAAGSSQIAQREWAPPEAVPAAVP